MNWPAVFFLSVLTISVSACTAWVEGKQAETICAVVRP